MSYPVQLVESVAIGGAEVTIRPQLPQDAELLQDFVRQLSGEAKYHRFFSPIRELPAGLLDHLLQVDYVNRLALIASVVEGGRERVVGEARYALDGSGDAEFSIAVADAWRGRGLGQVLLGKVEAAATAAGARCMVGDALRGNTGVLNLARRAGYQVVRGTGAGWTVRMEKPLGAGAALVA